MGAWVGVGGVGWMGGSGGRWMQEGWSGVVRLGGGSALDTLPAEVR